MKEELRRKYLLIRKNIAKKNIKDSNIFNKVITNKNVIDSEIVLIYVSKEDEIDTLKLITYFLKHKKVAVPKVEDNKMNFYYIDSLADLGKGCFNILEPKTNKKVENYLNSIVIVPGICFTKDGHRIGYGKGFYDKFLNSYQEYSIGLCYQECLIDNFKISDYDEKVDEIITE